MELHINCGKQNYYSYDKLKPTLVHDAAALFEVASVGTGNREVDIALASLG